MRVIAWIGSAWRNLRRADQRESDLDAEIGAALDLLVDAHVAAGRSPTDARRAAALELGGVEQLKERVREVRAGSGLVAAAHDGRHAMRAVWTSRGFSSVCVLVLALGIGASNAVFTIVNGMVLRGLPVPEPDRVVVLNDAANTALRVSYRDAADWRAAAPTLVSIALVADSYPITVGDGAHAPESVQAAYVSANAFALLGVPPIHGRDFQPADDHAGAPRVAMLGYRVWANRYLRDPGVVGRTIRVNNVPTVVIGVMPEGFRFPDARDLWMPIESMTGVQTERQDARMIRVFGRLADRASVGQAHSEMAAIVERVSRERSGASTTKAVTVSPFTGSIARLDEMWVGLFGGTAFLLLIGCANVAALILARATARRREIALRLSLGASRARVVRQLLAEHLLVGVIAGAVGLALSWAGIQLWSASIPNVDWPYWWNWSIDARVVLYLCAISLCTVIIFGVWPAWRLADVDANEVLKSGGHGTAGVANPRWTSMLLCVQLALTLILLAGAGLSLRSFLVLYRADAIVDTSAAVMGTLRLPVQKAPTPEARVALLDRLRTRLLARADVSAVSTTSTMPFIGASRWSLDVEGHTVAPEHEASLVSQVTIGDGYFGALGVGLVRGRAFDDRDGMPGQESAIVNQRFVDVRFPHDNPLGRRIRLTNPVQPDQPTPWLTIVGIAPSIRQQMAAPALDEVVYLPYRQNPTPLTWLLVRIAGPRHESAAFVREEFRALDQDLALGNVMWLDDILANTRFTSRFLLTVFVTFGSIALLMSAAGLYATTAYAVTRRTQEIGLRIALGAQPREVVWLFVRRTLFSLGIGLALGFLGVFALATLIRGYLVDTSATDPAVLLSVGTGLAAVAIVASIFPAMRSTRLNAVVALRQE